MLYKLKVAAKRGALLSTAAFVAVAAYLPAPAAFADSLNPLTERSLTLSSSSPGWAKTDGSNNSTYAPPNSGANGQKTGNYFSFKTSTDTQVTKAKAMSFQYCTGSAGDCAAPGNDDLSSTPGTDDESHSDLDIHFGTAAEVDNLDFATVVDTASAEGNVKAVPGYTNNNPKYQANGGTGDAAEAAKNVAGNFIVMWKNGGTWEQSTGWTATSSNQEEASSDTTGKQNTIILENSTGLGIPAGTRVKVLFFATATDYITNPGEGAFFVKINTFKNFDALSTTPGSENTLKDNIASGDVIDGGVTVANVMNQSIQITTKVLETMEFSVGTVDPNTLTAAELQASDLNLAQHTPCNRILTRMGTSGPQNVLELGDQTQESSLKTDQTYATHSYWRLSSNSSAGATVYYSGHTLSNTSGDEIEPIGTTAKASAQGSEQFGLAMATAALTPIGSTGFNTGSYGVSYASEPTYENAADFNGTVTKTGISSDQLSNLGALYTGTAPAVWSSADSNWDYTTTPLNASYHTPRLDPLTPYHVANPGTTDYGSGAGTISNGGTAKFAFDKMSDTIPAPIATEDSQVVDCVTAKMRYIANIAATTPAGIYTTKINYIAAPQY